MWWLKGEECGCVALHINSIVMLLSAPECDRREAIKKAAYVMGGALTAPTIAGIMKGCAPTMEPNWKPDYFSKEQAVTIMELSECILPATDTLGAKDLGVPRYIEEMVSVIYNRKNRENRILRTIGIKRLSLICRHYHVSVAALDEAQSGQKCV